MYQQNLYDCSEILANFGCEGLIEFLHNSLNSLNEHEPELVSKLFVTQIEETYVCPLKH